MIYHKNVAVIGYGRIGQAIKQYLKQEGFNVMAYDAKPVEGATILGKDGDGQIDYKPAVSNADCVIAATPFSSNIYIAHQCLEHQKAYFDLTEDVLIAQFIRDDSIPYVRAGKLAWISPQCGLAPGAVGMVANHLIDTFQEIRDVRLRVGALPQFASNKMKYYLTWSSEGLVNEYCNPCRVLVDGIEYDVPALDGYELIQIDGDEYEAFNTSGGIGSLIETVTRNHPSVRNINYKTLRYKGHRELLSFALDDLGLRNNQKVLVDLFNANVPRTTSDFVVIYVEVTGVKDGLLKTETYSRKIYGDDKFTAIQRTTAAGVCAMVYYWATSSYPQRNGYVPCEDVAVTSLNGNPFWDIFR